MIEINLVPDVKQELIKAQRIRSKVIIGSIFVGIISVGAVAALAFFVFTVQTVRSTLADSDIKEGNAKLLKVEDLSKTLTIQNQLTKISDLNSNKKITSRSVVMLSAIIPPSPNDIQVSKLNYDSSTNTVKIDGQAVNSYAALEVFKKTIEGAKVKYKDSDGKDAEVALASSISTKDVSYGQDSSGQKVLRFTISFVSANEMFSSALDNVSVIIATNGNVTDSYVGVPKSVFADRAPDLTEGK